MRGKWIGVVLFAAIFFHAPCPAQESPPGGQPLLSGPPLNRANAPSPLPRVKRAFEEADFWIGRLSDPDKVLLTPEEIAKVNSESPKRDPEALDIFSLPEKMDSASLKQTLAGCEDQYKKLTLYDLTNRPLSSDDFTRLLSNIQVSGIPPSVAPRYGVVVHKTDLRVLPTDDFVMDKPFDYAFDRFQSDRLDCGIPVVILHYSRDRVWCFIDTGAAKGWAKTNDIGVGEREEVRSFAAAKPLVVSGASVPFYGDGEMKSFAFDLPMGARLPFAGRDGDAYKVLMPWRGSAGELKFVYGFVHARNDVREGYLPYTLAGVLRQAFKLKDSPYSWGGMSEGRDCSRFLMEVFRCFGFQMPRDSYRQAVFYRERREDTGGWPESKKMKLLRTYEQTPTILYMRGHVMLFLGIVDDVSYAMHSYWDYSEDERPDVVYHIGRIVVSDLSLGKSGEGTLLQWISAVIPLR